jgi:hypothetical protein
MLLVHVPGTCGFGCEEGWTNGLVRMCKVAVTGYVNVLYQHLPGETEETHEKSQSELRVRGPGIEARASRTRDKLLYHLIGNFITPTVA